VVNEVAVVTTRLLKLSNRSGVFRQEIRERDTQALCADAEVTFVLSDGEKALPIEGEMRAMLSRLPSWG
jgi:thioesterase-3